MENGSSEVKGEESHERYCMSRVRVLCVWMAHSLLCLAPARSVLFLPYFTTIERDEFRCPEIVSDVAKVLR